MGTQTGFEALDAFFALVSFAIGAVVGSFLTVCSYRLPRNESITNPRRSRCPKCGNTIAWYDNIPIMSWLILGARCRHCKQSISWQYPLTEATTAVLFLLVFWRYGFVVATPVYMLFSAALVLVTFVDLTHWEIPDEVTYPGIPLGVACSLVAMFYPASGLFVAGPPSDALVLSSLLGVLLGGGSIYLLDKLCLILLKKPGMGFGDVKLMAMLGGFFGWPSVLFILMLASVVGSVAGVTMILAQRRRTHGEHRQERVPIETDDEREGLPEGHYLPFGPSLVFAALVV
ncbi:MAG TPA: prepilin peptidase, partial [Candidatus Hydrogenedentes bacterium]|nr:prepilin peptidase [Candidatus Hydrogenedentota bacterium]